jgi:hypothetical protein
MESIGQVWNNIWNQKGYIYIFQFSKSRLDLFVLIQREILRSRFYTDSCKIMYSQAFTKIINSRKLTGFQIVV